MTESTQERIKTALRLEELGRERAINQFNLECDDEISKTVSTNASHGTLVSGATMIAIANAHLKRTRKIIDNAIELRRAEIIRVPELATMPYLEDLLDYLERTVDAVSGQIPQHVTRHVPKAPAQAHVGIDQHVAGEVIKLKAHVRREVEILKHDGELRRPEKPVEVRPAVLSAGIPAEREPDPRRIFVVHGRNLKARDAMFNFLRAIDLAPIEWSEAVSFTGEGSPFTGQILDKAFSQAKAVVVLLTGDDLARLGTRFQVEHDPPYEKDPTPQPRPNVLFEAGMAFGRHPERTILVSLGHGRPFSDVAGRNEIRISNRAEDRQALVSRLKTAGCAVRTDGKTDWLTAGDFDAAIQKPDHEAGNTEADGRLAIPVVPASAGVRLGENEDDEDVRVFKEVRQMLQEKQANTWTPELGSKEDKIAERLVSRGWLTPGPLGGYLVRRRI